MIRKAIRRSELAVFRKGSRRSQRLRSRKASPPGHFGYDRQSQTTGANWLCFAKAVAAAIGYDLQSLPRQQIGYVSQSAGRSRLAVIGKAGARQHPIGYDPQSRLTALPATEPRPHPSH
jgi:hypothetical protein